MLNEESEKVLNFEVAKIEPKAGDIIVVRVKGEALHEDILNTILSLSQRNEDCVFVVLTDEQEMYSLTEDQLKQMGLQRIESA